MSVEDVPEIEEEGGLFEHHKVIADPGQAPLRIDKFLMDRLPNTSRTKLQDAAKSGYIKVNGQAVKSNFKVKSNDVITVELPYPVQEIELIPQDIPLNIVYEDDDLLVVNKDAGMVVHPAHANWTGTLVNALVHHFEQLPTSRNGHGRPGLIHRIDKNRRCLTR